jgi:hypothetical protein
MYQFPGSPFETIVASPIPMYYAIESLTLPPKKETLDIGTEENKTTEAWFEHQPAIKQCTFLL